MGRELVIAGAYLIALIVVGWINYWWFVGFALLTPVIATVLAFRESEFWPAVDPQYGFFWGMPAIFLVHGLILHHPAEWGQWLAWSSLIAVLITSIWTVTLRRWIDRQWAVLGTFCLVFVFVAFALNVMNGNLPQQRASEFATITDASPGGYRRLARIEVSRRSDERAVFFPGVRRYFEFGPGDAACVRTYSGGLGWTWVTIAPCTGEEIESAAAD